LTKKVTKDPPAGGNRRQKNTADHQTSIEPRRKNGKRFSVAVESWRGLSDRERKAVTGEAERLAAFRGIALTGVAFD
jgi:hypothetical protein